jgi:two-component system phosphate regulon response regulator PhoB
MYATSPSMRSNRKSVSESARVGSFGKPVEKACILIVEDEVDLRDMLSESLEQSGFKTVVAGTIGEAGRQLEQHLPDLVLLDWMLPDTTGPNWLRKIRRIDRFRNLPVIMLTARGEVSDRVSGLDSGADDYLVKPFSLKELQARIRAQLRKQQGDEEQEQYVAGDLVLNAVTHRVTAGDAEVLLGPTEFRLLQHFMMHPDRVYSRSQLLDSVWGQQVFIEERTVDVHIRRLRKALEPTGKAALIRTVRGTGYRFSTRGG